MGVIDIGLPKLIGGALLLALIVAVPAYAMRQHRRALAAEESLAVATANYEALASNARVAMALATKHEETQVRRSASVSKVKTEVSNARTDVPAACRPALRSLGAALDGVRRLQRESSGVESSRSLVCSGPTCSHG